MATMVYTSPITVATSQTIKAVALAPGKTVSNELVAAYVIQSSIPVDLFIDFEAGTAGDLVTTANLAAGTHGATAGTWSITYGSSGVNHSSIDSAPLARRTPVACNGTTYSGGGTRGMKIDMAGRTGLDNKYQVMTWTPPSPISGGMVTTAMVIFGLIGDVSNDTSVDHINVNSSSFAVLQETIPFNAITQPQIRAHGQVSGVAQFGPEIPVVSGTLYFIALYTDAVNGKARVIVLDGITYQLIGSSEASSDITNFVSIQVQDYLESFGGTTQWDGIALDWTNKAYPGEAFTIPSFTVSASQTAAQSITVAWSELVGVAYLLERNAGSGWSTVSSSATSPYVDSGLSGATYQYRVTASLVGVTEGPHLSSSVPLTVDTPVITPSSGSYTSPLTVSITSDTPGVSLYYTTDGSTPSNSSTLYSGSFTLTATTATVKAIGYATGYATSSVSSQTYTYVPFSPIINQDFEGVGTPSGWGSFGTVNFNSVISPLAGLQSLRVDGTGGAGAATVNPSSGSELFGKFLFRAGALPATSSKIILTQDAGSNNPCEMAIFHDGTIAITDTAGVGDIRTSGALSAGSIYQIYWHYKKGTGANGVMEIGFSQTNVRPSSGSSYAGATNCAATTDIQTLLTYVDGGILVDYDNFQVATTTFN